MSIGKGSLIGGTLGGLYGLLSPLQERQQQPEESDAKRRLHRALGYGALGAVGGAILGAPIGVPVRKKSMSDLAPWMKNVATKADAKRAYRAASRVAHPDAGGSNTAMQDLNEAWEAVQNHPEFSKLGHVQKAYAVGYYSALNAFLR